MPPRALSSIIVGSIIENTDDVNSQKYTAISKLESLIKEYNEKLLSNPTFGTSGKYFIPVKIDLNSISPENVADYKEDFKN